ncbi:MAG: diphthine synthase [Thaumarchaeota archaeon]|nr:diphthine synthase [Candidatus Calditenuaceae archaeon]MDW8041829.1 diphthine synthase [Nitrososphaerota archaeon]
MLWLIGLGLGSRGYVTDEAWRAMSRSSTVYLDTYTSFIDDDLLNAIRDGVGDRLVMAERATLEERSRELINRAADEDVAVVVPGDPLVATTHSSLIVEACRSGIPWRVVHGVSILSAAISRSGLSPYKFGRTVTLPRGAEVEVLRGIWKVVMTNATLGLHTMVLLDTAGGGLTAQEAAEMLLESADRSDADGALKDAPVVYGARIGMKEEKVGVVRLGALKHLDLPPPPHVLILPAELGPGEREFFREVLRSEVKPASVKSPTHVRAAKYLAKAKSVVMKLEVGVESTSVRRAIETVSDYLSDAEHFLNSGREEDALVAVSYAEGILDALRLLGAVRFEW